MIRKYILIFIVFSFTLGVCILFAQEEPATSEIASSIENVDTATADATIANTNTASSTTNVARRVVLDKDFLEAEKLFFDKKYYIARRAFLKYLDEHPLSTNDMLYYYLASTYYVDKDYASAIDYYKIALDLNGTPFYYNNVANSYYQMKSYPDALMWYQRSIGRIENAPVFEIVEEVVETNYIQTNYITNISLMDISVYKSLVDRYRDIESLSKNIDAQQNLTSTGDINATIDEAAANASITSGSEDDLENGSTEEATETEIVASVATPAVTAPNVASVKDKMESISDMLINRIENELFLSQTNIFVNTFYTNIATNFVSATNWQPQFTGATSSPEPTSVDEGAATLSPNTMSRAELNVYYSPYLHTANTYLKLGQYKEAQIYYEVFLTNVGNEYYQYEKISQLIDELKNVEITNSVYIQQQVPISMITTTNEVDNSISTIYYDNGQQEIIETVFENGDSSKLQKYKDGTIVNTQNYADGSSVVESIYANGKKEIETIDSNGSIVRTSFDIDSTKRIFSTNTITQSQYSYIEYPDGNNITKISDDNKNTTLIERLDASFTKYELLSDGTKDIYTLNTDGSELHRVEYPDGKVEISVEYPDGATVDRINYADNTVKGVSKYPDGSTTFTSIDASGLTTITTTYLDGSTVSRVVNQGDTENPVMLTTSMYDENKNFITTTVGQDGAITIVTKSPDSTLKTEVVSTDGTITAEIQKPTGFVDTKTTLPDGSTTSIINTALGTTTESIFVDGSSTTEIKDNEGNTTTIKKNLDKSTRVDIINTDGSFEKTLLNEDGSGSIEALDKSGNSIKTTIYRNGISKSTVEKADNTKIDVIKSNNEKNTVMTFENGEVYRLNESAGRRASLRIDVPEMTSRVAVDVSELETAEAISTIENILAEASVDSKSEVFTKLKTALDYSDDYIMLLDNLDTLEIVYTYQEDASKRLASLADQLAKEELEAERERQKALEEERLELERERLEAEAKAREESESSYDHSKDIQSLIEAIQEAMNNNSEDTNILEKAAEAVSEAVESVGESVSE